MVVVVVMMKNDRGGMVVVKIAGVVMRREGGAGLSHEWERKLLLLQRSVDCLDWDGGDDGDGGNHFIGQNCYPHCN